MHKNIKIETELNISIYSDRDNIQTTAVFSSLFDQNSNQPPHGISIRPYRDKLSDTFNYQNCNNGSPPKDTIRQTRPRKVIYQSPKPCGSSKCVIRKHEKETVHKECIYRRKVLRHDDYVTTIVPVFELLQRWRMAGSY